MSQSIIKQLSCVANQITSAIETACTKIVDAIAGNAAPDYTELLNSIINELQNIDANTDALETTLTSINTDTTAIASNTADIIVELQSILTALQDIDANTDNVESLLETLISTILSREPTQLAILPEICGTSDGGTTHAYFTPAQVWNTINSTLVAKLFFDTQGDPVTGVVAADPCECECIECGSTELACILVDGFDAELEPDVGDNMTFEVLLDGTNQATVVHDYTTTEAGGNKSTWYAPLITAINAVAGWTITLQTDVAVGTPGKPTWRVEYSGTTASTLVIDKEGGGSVITLTADGAGNITGTDNWAGGTSPFGTCA